MKTGERIAVTLNFSFLPQYWVYYRNGLFITLIYAAITVVMGTLLGTVIAMMRMTRNYNPLNWVSRVYIEVLRGTPLMVQVFIIYFGLTSLKIRIPEPAHTIPMIGSLTKFTFGALALSLNSGAYVAEIIRSGIQAVDSGQGEAARSLGLSGGRTMWHIILPQAVRNILPALGNEFIVIIKESSIVSIIGVAELMFNADTVFSMTYRRMETLIVAAGVYLVLTMVLSFALSRVERRMSRGRV